MEQNFCMYCMNLTSDDICNVCGKNIREYRPAPHHLQPGTILSGKYVVGAVLGEGGFGITYIGRETNLDIKVAIKEYFPSGVVNRNNTSSSELSIHIGEAQDFFEKGKKSFLGEARTLAKFSNEPSIVSVRDFFSENNTAYIVMEYLEGIDLGEYIRQHGKMSFEQAVTMLTPVMKTLSKIHAHGLIHRDISPANIMILKDGTVKLLDFGAAREVGGADEKSLSILLKPGFAPEEQYRSRGHQGPWTDVYALSATMYKMMTGHTPIDVMNRVYSDDLEKITDLNPDVTPEQEAVILKGMAVQQGNRYQSIDDLFAGCQTETVKDQASEKTIGVFEDNNNWTGAGQNNQSQSRTQPESRTQSEPQAQSESRTQPEPGMQREPQAQPEPVPKKEKVLKGDKKPSIAAFAGSVVTGLLTMEGILGAASQIIDKLNPVFPIILTVLFGAATFFLGRLYFPRIDNKKRKPNVFCLAASILSFLYTVYLAWTTYTASTNFWTEESYVVFRAVETVMSLAVPIFFGYFYYPRLNRKKKGLFLKIYGGIAVAGGIAFVIGIMFMNVNTVTIGDKNFERDVTQVRLAFDIITDNDLQKLRELKNLESLEIVECFLDDADVKTIGELTQLKKLSLCGNTDITDVSPLNNLTNLTYLNISITKTADISCLDQLVNLEMLNISNTNVGDLSVLSKFTKLDSLFMDSVDGLDAATITLPATVRTLYCSNNELESLAFVSGSEELTTIYAANNNISDLTPLSGYRLYTVNLSGNAITDLSPLQAQSIGTLNVSGNAITDISCLKGIPASQLNLSYNQISDISALADNYNIHTLRLNNNQVTDISPLKDCFNIFSLNISFNRISDISALETIDDMEIFEARGNCIVDISPLASCGKLIEKGSQLDLRDNQITSVSALSEYVNTKYMYLSGNKITDISPLASCTALRTLTLNNNQLTDVSALSALKNLRALEVVSNPITNVEELYAAAADEGITDHTTLRVSYDEGIDFAALAAIENLNVIIYDATERQKKSLRELGFRSFSVSAELDEVETDSDSGEDESGTEDTNG